MPNSNCVQAGRCLIERLGTFRLSGLNCWVAANVLSDQCLHRAEMPIREVLESPFAVEQSFLHGCERLDRGHEVVVVVHQLEFDCSGEGGIARQRGRGLGLVTMCFDERMEAQSLKPLRDCAPVPPKGLCCCLHVKVLLSQTIQHRRIAGRVGKNL